MQTLTILLIALALGIVLSTVPSEIAAWEGYDYESSSHIEIEKGNLVRPGRDIEVYEYGEGYKTFEVQDINRRGSNVEVEVYDYETGEYRTFEMDR